MEPAYPVGMTVMKKSRIKEGKNDSTKDIAVLILWRTDQVGYYDRERLGIRKDLA
jgi:hypothetical protein